MHRRFVSFLVLIFPFVLYLNSYAFAAGEGTVQGYVRDSQTHSVLPGANVLVVGTSLGASTGLDGHFTIADVPSGIHKIRVTYIGYETKVVNVKVTSNATMTVDFRLEAVGVKGKQVVVTAQASGQNGAINQQLSSNQIVSVVSAARIQELPDANAAESVGRLPGVSVIRSGGEGYEVVIRGLQPKYNDITIDGIQMASSNPDNRSTNLSMISSNMLAGIQVAKTVTPDMNANVIGGTVDFELREAQVNKPGVPVYRVLVQGGYNNLPNAYNKYNNYKYVGSVEDRFFHERLGIFAQVDVERMNLSSNQMGASYTNAGNSITDYWTNGLNLNDVPSDLLRRNGALVLDYRLPNGSIKFDNFLSTGTTSTLNRGENFGISDNALTYSLGSSRSALTTLINGLDFKEHFSIFKIRARVSQAYSQTKDPNDWSINFLQTSASLNQFSHVASVDPQAIPKAANYDFSGAYLQNIVNSSSLSKSQLLTGSLSFTTNLNISNLITGNLKFGGRYQHQTRSYAFQEYNGQSANGGSALFVDSLIEANMLLPINTRTGIPMTYFVDPSFSYGKFLGGDYTMVGPLSVAKLNDVINIVNRNLETIANNNGAVTYARNNYLSTISNYSGYENTSAFYVMPTINIGPQLSIIGGVRYQNLETVYSGVRGMVSPESFYSYDHYDTTVTQNHGYWLPDVALKYSPLSWLNIRLSYTHTLAYPDYNAIIPRIDLQTNYIGWNNYKVAPSRSTNYDAYLSVYNNAIGLLTGGVFLKNISGLIYPWSFHVSGANVLPYYPYGVLGNSIPTGNYQISTFVNDSSKVLDYGAEFDWQTHFWYLPGVLSGIVLSANYTHIFSKAHYPYTYTKISSRSIQYVDTSFVDRLLYQPDDIINLSLGFDYKDFSVLVSMIYQSNIFTGPNFWPQLRSRTAAYRRWDLAANQKLPWFGLSAYLDINNLNGANDVSVIEGGGVPISYQDYGMTADLGIRWKL